MTFVRTVIIALALALAGAVALPAVAGGSRLYGNRPAPDEQSHHQRHDRARYLSPETAAPTLTVEPPGGPPGSLARITGSTFHEHVAAYFGPYRMRILKRGRHYLVVQIPSGVRRAHFIYVVDSTGQARTARRFFVGPERRYPHYSPHRHAVIQGAPEFAMAGGAITIQGRYFDRETRVFFGNRELEVIERLPRTLVVELPPDLHGRHYLYVSDRGSVSRSPQRLRVETQEWWQPF